ncbi:MAG: LysR family transcriptional regulator [Bilophila wadsworthia]
MELRVLRYFLAVAREESISGAAAALHVTQPTLSRQMMELEEELGKTLFLRGKRKISLTEEGMFLRKRAQEIVTLVEKTESEFSAAEETISGDAHIGGGETDAMRLIARAAHRLQSAYPHIAYHLFSGNADDVTAGRGLVDFMLIEPAICRSTTSSLPVTDIWGCDAKSSLRGKGNDKAAGICCLRSRFNQHW